MFDNMLSNTFNSLKSVPWWGWVVAVIVAIIIMLLLLSVYNRMMNQGEGEIYG